MMSLKRSISPIYFILIIAHLFAPLALAQEGGKEVLVVDITGPVTPIMLSLIERSIAEAETRGAEALIIRMDTPGGSVELTQRIIQAIIAADVPVVVYIWPPGGHAASAGTFITLAGHVAAMAPRTSIGAASPIDSNGADISETLRAKIQSILVADIKGLADRRGEKAIQWAEQAITEAKAASADEALKLGVIDFVAKDTNDLLKQMDGFKVEVAGEEVTLATAGAKITPLQTTVIEELLGILTNPTIALFLISIGGLAIVYEIANPGGYMSGVVGVICLVIGLYALGQLPVNYAGLALILLALALFGAEFFVHSHGALTTGGVVSFIVGALILFNTDEFTYQLPWPSIIGIPAAIALVLAFAVRKAWQARRAKPVTGQEGLLGSIGTVKVALEPQGSVFVLGERWQATSASGQPIPAGERVRVTAVEGLHLKVEKLL